MSVVVSNQCKLFWQFSELNQSLSQSVVLFSRSPSCSAVGCWRLSLSVVAAVVVVVVPAGPH